MDDAIGWASSFVLLLTIGKQVHKQWHEHTAEGVSKWLFVGQTAASMGFTIYSWLVGNWVFVVTNFLLLIAGLVGLAINVRQRRRDATGRSQAQAQAQDRQSEHAQRARQRQPQQQQQQAVNP